MRAHMQTQCMCLSDQISLDPDNIKWCYMVHFKAYISRLPSPSMHTYQLLHIGCSNYANHTKTTLLCLEVKMLRLLLPW